ncbi:MAG: shikimate dehydrogenase [Candidatus Omnitrophota bacterium]|nr:shikimate dehydrogenase [Candidatus Omnitrophota bacterium]
MTPHKRTYGLLGRGINYSLSPVMHNAAFEYFGVPATYELFDIEEEKLGDFFRNDLIRKKVSGINVTVPYKVKIKEMLESDVSCSLDEATQRLGAVNTVKVEEEGLIGFNTDGKGFYESLLEDTGYDPAAGTIFVLGAGGAGRAICFYLAAAEDPVERIFVFDVDGEKVSALETDFKKHFGPHILVPVGEKDIPGKTGKSDLLVNATPMGTKKEDISPGCPGLPGFLRKDMVVYDLVYCRETELVREARKKGITTANGLGMLVNQAALAFDIWIDESFYLGEIKKVMKDAAETELKKKY